MTKIQDTKNDQLQQSKNWNEDQIIIKTFSQYAPGNIRNERNHHIQQQDAVNGIQSTIVNNTQYNA